MFLSPHAGRHVGRHVGIKNICEHSHYLIYTMSQKNCAKLFLSELRQTDTNFDNFWPKHSKEAGSKLSEFMLEVSPTYMDTRT